MGTECRRKDDEGDSGKDGRTGRNVERAMG